MKTTIELPDSLLQAARAHARKRQTTLRMLIMDGLETVMARDQTPKQPFQLRDGAQHLGKQLVKSWPEMRAIIYEGRGGGQ